MIYMQLTSSALPLRQTNECKHLCREKIDQGLFAQYRHGAMRARSLKLMLLKANLIAILSATIINKTVCFKNVMSFGYVYYTDIVCLRSPHLVNKTILVCVKLFSLNVINDFC